MPVTVRLAVSALVLTDPEMVAEVTSPVPPVVPRVRSQERKVKLGVPRALLKSALGTKRMREVPTWAVQLPPTPLALEAAMVLSSEKVSASMRVIVKVPFAAPAGNVLPA